MTLIAADRGMARLERWVARATWLGDHGMRWAESAIHWWLSHRRGLVRSAAHWGKWRSAYRALDSYARVEPRPTRWP